jgi:hypothetical protein
MFRKTSGVCAVAILVSLSSVASAAHRPSHGPSGFYFGGPYAFGYNQPAGGPCGWYYHQAYYYRHPGQYDRYYYHFSQNEFRYCSNWH